MNQIQEVHYDPDEGNIVVELQLPVGGAAQLDLWTNSRSGLLSSFSVDHSTPYDASTRQWLFTHATWKQLSGEELECWGSVSPTADSFVKTFQAVLRISQAEHVLGEVRREFKLRDGISPFHLFVRLASTSTSARVSANNQ